MDNLILITRLSRFMTFQKNRATLCKKSAKDPAYNPESDSDLSENIPAWSENAGK
jgi:hypothetical protein